MKFQKSLVCKSLRKIGGEDKVFSELSVKSGDWFIIVDATARTFLISTKPL